MTRAAPLHRLAIDLTEHVQFAGSGRGVPRRKWDRFPPRLERSLGAALGLLERTGTRATFFVDGWVAERHPALVAEVARRGHEVAARGLDGERLGDTVRLLEEAGGQAVQGWRAPAGLSAREVGERTTAAGLRYAVAPVAPAGGRAAPVIPSGGFLSTGEGLRMLPEALVPAVLRSWAQAGTPRVLSFAVWELDPDVPHLAIHGGLGGLRAYRNLDAFEARLGRLLEGGQFTSLRESLRLPATARDSAPAPQRAAEAAPRAAALPVPATVVVPCFNEEPGLAYLSRVLGGLEAETGGVHRLRFVLVDDGSTDGTWAEMQRLFGDRPGWRLVRHPRNRGIGAAIATGIAAAEDEVVAVIDSDCSYDPARIANMLALLTPDVAAVTASPYHPLGGVEGVPQWRLVLSKGASALYRLVLRNKLATYTSCFRIYRRSLVAGLPLRHEGYIGVVEMLARLDLEGRRVVEYPVTLETRLLGQSKLKIMRAIMGHLRFLGELAAQRLADRRRPPTMKVAR